VTCPTCGSERLVRVEFGFPSRRMMDAAERGEIVLGGCAIPDERPDLKRAECLDCRARVVVPEGV
jgi:hypothetical protein